MNAQLLRMCCLAMTLCLVAPAASEAASGMEPDATSVSLFAPEDGGTPRDVSRIATVGPGEFRIRACVEEGPGVLTHAVSRVDLVCRNERRIANHHTASGPLGRWTPDQCGQQRLRRHVHARFPLHSAAGPALETDRWQHVEGWVCTVRFSAPPGETKVGLSPWYTYGDYLRFVQSLPDHPHLKKTRLGTSDGGREHWELTITDPNVPTESKTHDLLARTGTCLRDLLLVCDGGPYRVPAVRCRRRGTPALPDRAAPDDQRGRRRTGLRVSRRLRLSPAARHRHGQADLRRDRPTPTGLRGHLAQLDRSPRRGLPVLHGLRGRARPAAGPGTCSRSGSLRLAAWAIAGRARRIRSRRTGSAARSARATCTSTR